MPTASPFRHRRERIIMTTEHRRSHRKRAHQAIQVNNAITGQQIGHVGNLSSDGMLLISNRQMPDDSLFQFSFHLPNGHTAHMHQLEVGVHEQWCETANVPGLFWTGFRIIDISPDDFDVLTGWVTSPAGQFD
jgi:hypothetical protein